MINYMNEGKNFREQIKAFVYEFMQKSGDCAVNAKGMKTAEIFRQCGLDWGEYENSTSSNQQYWLVALLRELEKESKIQRDLVTKLWRVK